MEAVAQTTQMQKKSKSLWQHAWINLKKDKYAMVALTVVVIYSLIAIGSSLGLLAGDWRNEITGEVERTRVLEDGTLETYKDVRALSYHPPSKEAVFGTDIFGRSVLAKTIKGTEVAMSVGLITAIIATVIGVALGAVSGYFGGKIDEVIVWFYTTFSSIPYIMLLVAITFILGKGLVAVYLALGLTGWVSLCRLVRGEVMRHKERDYVHAAASIGGGNFRKLFKHIMPNIIHIVIINFSLQFQTAIKSEVILSYLGLGVQGRPSWGTMIDDAKLELSRADMVWWQLAAATFAMFVVVLAFNILGDALRDALDPKLKGK